MAGKGAGGVIDLLVDGAKVDDVADATKAFSAASKADDAASTSRTISVADEASATVKPDGPLPKSYDGSDAPLLGDNPTSTTSAFSNAAGDTASSKSTTRKVVEAAGKAATAPITILDKTGKAVRTAKNITIGGLTLAGGAAGATGLYKISGFFNKLKDGLEDPLKKLKEKIVTPGGTSEKIWNFAGDNAGLIGGVVAGFLAPSILRSVPLVGSTVGEWLGSWIKTAAFAGLVYLGLKGVCAWQFGENKGEEFKPDDPTTGIPTNLNLSASPPPFVPAPAAPGLKL